MNGRARAASGAGGCGGQIADAAAAFRHLRDILLREPELVDGIRRAGTPDAMAEALARIGALRGIPTDAAELRGYVARLAGAAPVQPLGDEMLDGVAGGLGKADGNDGRDFLDVLLAGEGATRPRQTGP